MSYAYVVSRHWEACLVFQLAIQPLFLSTSTSRSCASPDYLWITWEFEIPSLGIPSNLFFYWVLSPPWGSDWIYGCVLGNHQILLLSAPLEYSLPLYPSCLYSPALWEQYFSLRESSPTSLVLYSLGAVLFVIYPEAPTYILLVGFGNQTQKEEAPALPGFSPDTLFFWD